MRTVLGFLWKFFLTSSFGMQLDSKHEAAAAYVDAANAYKKKPDSQGEVLWMWLGLGVESESVLVFWLAHVI